MTPPLQALDSILGMPKINVDIKRYVAKFKSVKPKTLKISAATIASLLVVTAGLVWVNQPKPPVIDYRFTAKDVGVQMFGWNWNSLAKECTEQLGPSGVSWILVDPPTDHIRGKQWWIHYQPTNYDINSDHGTREEFKSMVATCQQAGVAVLADAVINHMANGWFVSYGGKAYGKNLKYADVYTRENFHEGLNENDPHYCAHDITNWNELWERTNCRFPGLPDLATEQEFVRNKIAGYLSDLQSLGVAGFRFDAAKHMAPEDIAAIMNKLKTPAFLIQEISGDAETSEEYQGNGHVWAWRAADDISSAFAYAAKVSTEMVGMSERWADDYPADLAVTWVNNHDTERDGGSLSYKSKTEYPLAAQFLLAQPVGQPMLFSGFRFSLRDEGAPQDDSGKLLDPVCGPEHLQYTCFHRETAVKGMIAWHKLLSDKKMTAEKGEDGIYQMQRDGAGFFGLNFNKKSAKDRKVDEPVIATGLPEGKYCDLVSNGGLTASGSDCQGLTFDVDSQGNLVQPIPPLSSIALAAYKVN